MLVSGAESTSENQFLSQAGHTIEQLHTRNFTKSENFSSSLMDVEKLPSSFIDLSTRSTWRRWAWLPDNFLLPHCSGMAHYELYWSLLIVSLNNHQLVIFIETRECNDSTNEFPFSSLSCPNVINERIVVSSLFFEFSMIGQLKSCRGKATSYSRLLTFRVAQFVSYANWINAAIVFYKHLTKQLLIKQA